MIWNNKSYILQRQVENCPAEDWPYLVDGLVAVGALTAASVVQVADPTADKMPHRFSVPLFVFGSAMVASTLGGVGEVIGCNRKVNTKY